MSHLLKHREKDDKWRLYTTISEGWLTGWLTADAMLRELEHYQSTDYKLKMIELYWTFPHGYYDYDNVNPKRLTNFPAVQAYTEWHLKALKSRDYYGAVDAKFKELVGHEQTTAP